MIESIRMSVLTLLMTLVTSILHGTVLWICFPFIHYLFPLALENGILPPYLNWWACVMILWMINIVFKNTQVKVENKFIVNKENED